MGRIRFVTMRTRVALFRITLIGALAMVSAQHTYTTRNGKPTSDAQPGEPCIANACAPGSYCSINSETPICSEKCHNTKTRKGRQIPKRFKYFCNYGDEKPIKSNGYLDDRLPEPGFACDQTAMLVIPQGKEEACKGGAWDWLTHPRKEGCHVSEGCDVDSWCNIGEMLCEENCFSTKTRNGGDIPRQKGWCNYGDEDPEDMIVARDRVGFANRGQIGDRCMGMRTGNYKCAGNAWCHEQTFTCYEDCEGPNAKDIPRVDRWGHFTAAGQFCDYSGVSMSERFHVWVKNTFGISTTMLLPVLLLLVICVLLFLLKVEFAQKFLVNMGVVNKEMFDNSFAYAGVGSDDKSLVGHSDNMLVDDEPKP